MVAIEKKEFKEALHYLNIMIRNCPDSMNFISFKIECLINLSKYIFLLLLKLYYLIIDKLAEAIEFTT